MNAPIMALCLFVGFVGFGVSISRRLRLLRRLSPIDRADHVKERFGRLIRVALLQSRVMKYPVAGLLHVVLFWGFLLLLLNTVVLWGRGFDPAFDLFFFSWPPVGPVLREMSHGVAAAVLIAAVLALSHRVVLRPSRLRQSAEGVLILLLIIVMMIADLSYWLGGYSAGMWIHAVLVLVFLNLLPAGKHFHVLTSLPNVYFSDLSPPGRLPPDDNIARVLAHPDTADDEEVVFGVSSVTDFSWKDGLDLFSCTECGRCTEHCPAAAAGSSLRPGSLIMSLRDHLKREERSALRGEAGSRRLIPEVVDPEVVWSCTTCRACEEECPLLISVVDKIVRMRRDLVESRGELPSGLSKVLRSLETSGNPWNLAPQERNTWADGLDVPLFSAETCEYLLFVGCSGSLDPRGRKTVRALSRLLTEAGVRFGILGEAEPCCGELARRIGSESLFLTMSSRLIEIFQQAGVKKIITPCPHCFNTFSSEYPVSGGDFEVSHHTQVLADLLAQGRLLPRGRVETSVVLHDACYLGRTNGILEAPRRILDAIPGLTRLSPVSSGNRSDCCGAGGGGFFIEKRGGEQLNERRVRELRQTGAAEIGTTCPWCRSMLGDGGGSDPFTSGSEPLDVAELLLISIGDKQAGGAGSDFQ